MRTNRWTDVRFDTTKLVVAFLSVLRTLKLQIWGAIIFITISRRVAE